MLSRAWLTIAQHVFQPALTGRPELISRKIVSGEPGTKAIEQISTKNCLPRIGSKVLPRFREKYRALGRQKNGVQHATAIYPIPRYTRPRYIGLTLYCPHHPMSATCPPTYILFSLPPVCHLSTHLYIVLTALCLPLVHPFIYCPHCPMSATCPPTYILSSLSYICHLSIHLYIVLTALCLPLVHPLIYCPHRPMSATCPHTSRRMTWRLFTWATPPSVRTESPNNSSQNTLSTSSSS